MIQILGGIIGEILLQAVAEALIELGLRSLAEPFRRPPNPWLAAIGYMILGAIVGGLSLIVLSSHMVVSKDLRIINLIITPVFVGLFMSAIGAWRAKRGQLVLRIDRFAYGYLFALSFALVRYWLAK